MRLLLLPGTDGTGLLFEPLVKALPSCLTAHVVAYPPEQPLGVRRTVATYSESR